MKTVVITGASTGIGRAAAEHLAGQGWSVFAGVRKHSDGEPLKQANSNITPIILDVAKPDQVKAAVQTVSKALDGKTLDGLVNNAGIANMGPLALQPMDEFEQHFEVNVFGLMRTTQAFLPLLGMDEARSGKKGRIVNITSVGGRLSAPFLGAYAATKHAVEAITDALRRELLIYGIDAIAIGPGSVKTPIWDKAEDMNKNQPYANSVWAKPIEQFADVMLKGGKEGLEPKVIGETIETALSDDSPKARYAPVPNKLTNWTIPKLLPKRMVDKAMAKRYGLEKKD
ncbi:SDR family oxidoreductase [Henriciella sp. AS95]|uniref:SDR family oxidoreductase n=1 Tax=Henriciella sp. AS95 TaxID=3135782 RepID=UPI00317D257A